LLLLLVDGDARARREDGRGGGHQGRGATRQLGRQQQAQVAQRGQQSTRAQQGGL
jgi:hypothetical protein